MAKIVDYLMDSKNPFPWDETGDNCLLLKIEDQSVHSEVVGSRKTLNKKYNHLIMNLLNIGDYLTVQDYLLVEIMTKELWKDLTKNVAIEKSIFDKKVKESSIKIIRSQLLDTMQ